MMMAMQMMGFGLWALVCRDACWRQNDDVGTHFYLHRTTVVLLHSNLRYRLLDIFDGNSRVKRHAFLINFQNSTMMPTTAPHDEPPFDLAR